MHRALTVWLASAALAALSLVHAADPPMAASVPVDDDFVLQGEYVGCIEQPAGCSQSIGLQVVALGDGRFQAVEYVVGLPGNGGTMERRLKLSGSVTDGTVVLTGESRRIVVRKGCATVSDAAGRELGRIEKYHRLSHTLGARAPAGAKMLFNGVYTDRLVNASVTDDRLLNVGADTRESYRDFSLHVEFRTPYMPPARSQGRGNSGVYLQGRYEVQILDSFGLDGRNNDCGGIYLTRAPIVNMSFPPLAWQTYDIDFSAARFDDAGQKTGNARITVRHNGIVIHKDYEIPNKTGAGAPEGSDARPIRFQNHNNPVHFRNIWLVERRPGEPLPDYSAPRDCCVEVTGGRVMPERFDLPGRSPLPLEIVRAMPRRR